MNQTAKSSPIMLSDRVACIDISKRKTLTKLDVWRARSKMAFSPKKQQQGDAWKEARSAMKRFLEARFTHQFLETETTIRPDAASSDQKLQSYHGRDPSEIKKLVEVVERLLFAQSLKSLDKYADTSNLDEKLRCIVKRVLRRVIRTECQKRKTTHSSTVALTKRQEKDNATQRRMQTTTFIKRESVREGFRRMSITMKPKTAWSNPAVAIGLSGRREEKLFGQTRT
mmetsp:Transcript_9247/g.19399  ORF Transcript_9247/g.19399 Transcript_9247/m.19399 type:complete len:227 (+) Transcript_9247:132-812(+)